MRSREEENFEMESTAMAILSVAVDSSSCFDWFSVQLSMT